MNKIEQSHPSVDVRDPREIALYIHWPFCIAKCPYCDFNSHVAKTIDTDNFIQGYIKELDYFAPVLAGRTINSVYFGGGTPSLAPISFFEQILVKLQQLAEFAPQIEITMEANPSSVEVQKFKAVKSVGINRLSLGVQSLNEDELRFLGRAHNAKEALIALETVARVFDRYSFDLMYALPNHTESGWRSALEQALQFANSHISLYQLTIEKGTRFYADHEAGKFQLPDQDTAAALYQITAEILGKRDLDAYEISNYAVSGHESRHNLAYWRYQDYLGIGAGAHSRITYKGQKHAIMMSHNPDKWRRTVDEQGVAIQQNKLLDAAAQYVEKIMMGMRLRSGMLIDDIRWHGGIEQLLAAELLVIADQSIKATPRGFMLLNYVIAQMITC